ncbi:GNAT family N-acetyltransferase [Niveibacterium terrae]|uniref:GNAT family N-acetyltransferase n=1 Tax=Niveibacterium terrae TaxID=3373598 RepID=UPI003A8CC61B
MRIVPGDFSDPQVIELLRIHLAGMHRTSPKESVFALDLSGLQSPHISFWTIWEGDTLLGCGALKELSGDSGELKSMRTHPDHLRRGAARRLLAHLLDLARARGYHRLSLETGSGEAFEPALALYRNMGFANGEAFGDYAATGFNQFLHLDM